MHRQPTGPIGPYSSLWRKSRGFAAVLAAVLALGGMASRGAAASSYPPYWTAQSPWHGVTLVHSQPSNEPTPSDIDLLVNSLGVNSIHIDLAIKRFTQMSNLSLTEGYAESISWLESMLAECHTDHVAAIVRFKSFYDPSTDQFYDVTSPDFWNNAQAVANIVPEVADLVSQLKDDGAVVTAYDIFSEPTMIQANGQPVQPPNWPSIQSSIVAKIHSIDPNLWVVVKPGPYGGISGYSDFQPLSGSNLIYGVHDYSPHPYTHQGINGEPYGVSYPATIGGQYWNKTAEINNLQPVLQFEQAHHVLMWVDEFSTLRWAPDSEIYLTDLAGIYNNYDWGWSYFAWGGWNGFDPNFDTQYPNDNLYVGQESQRWATLRQIFAMPVNDPPPGGGGGQTNGSGGTGGSGGGGSFQWPVLLILILVCTLARGLRRSPKPHPASCPHVNGAD